MSSSLTVLQTEQLAALKTLCTQAEEAKQNLPTFYEYVAQINQLCEQLAKEDVPLPRSLVHRLNKLEKFSSQPLGLLTWQGCTPVMQPLTPFSPSCRRKTGNHSSA